MIERLTEPGSDAGPHCRCGAEMVRVRVERRSADTLVKFFMCRTCDYDLRVMVWDDEPTGESAPR